MGKTVITGIGVITSAGIGKEKFINAVKNTKSCIHDVSLFDTSKYYCKQAGEVKDICGHKNRAYNFLKICIEEAINDANLQTADLLNTKLIIGTAHGPLSDWQLWIDKTEKIECLTPEQLTENVAKSFGIKNYLTVSTACTSSTIALLLGLQDINKNEQNIVIVAGVDVLTEFIFAGFTSLRALTHSVCKPFDKFRDGLVLGEGAGCVILEDYKHAKNRNAKIYCELASVATTSDAKHFTAPSFTGEGLYRCMKQALEEAQINISEISYINAHGTGTIYNDRTECIAIKKLFGEYAYKIPISSIKSIIGHTSGACGVIEVCLCAICIKEGFIPATLNFSQPEEEFNFNFVQKTIKSNVSVVLSTNLAFGGSNASCVFRKV